MVDSASAGASAIHRRHAAARILAVLALLISIATLRQGAILALAFYFAALLAACLTARLPVRSMLWTSAAVLPFALCFAAVSAIAGEPARAVWMLLRAYLSSLAALFLIATTPMPQLIAGLEWLQAPRFLLQVMQFLYRYLIVLVEEARAMRLAGSVRAGAAGMLQFRQAAAAAGVLFARAYARAEAIHRAMISRGFEGRLPVFAGSPFRSADAAFLACAVVLIVGVRAVFR